MNDFNRIEIYLKFLLNTQKGLNVDNNTKRLNKSIESLNNGDTVTKTLEELGIEEDDEFLGFYEDDWWGDEQIKDIE